MDKKTQKWILAAIVAVILLLTIIIWLILGNKSNIDTGGNGDDSDYGIIEGKAKDIKTLKKEVKEKYGIKGR